MKIIFFGSGDFTLSIVKKIHTSFDLIGVIVTKPRPRGRGLQSSWTEIAKWAKEHYIEVYTPEDPNALSFVDRLNKLKPSLFVLSSYGHILSRNLLDVPNMGSLNIHPSLLPKYRGAAPIQRAIMAGEDKTGITIFFMDEKIDHGEIIVQEELAIKPDENYGSLCSRLSELGAEIIVRTIESIESGTYKKMPQNNSDMSYAPKIKKSEMVINWQNNTFPILNLIRALSPKPGAETTFREKKIKILNAVSGKEKFKPGEAHVDKKSLCVGTDDGSIDLRQVKPQDKGAMSGLDFKNGFRIKEGEVFG